jgi:hypothetical protein
MRIKPITLLLLLLSLSLAADCGSLVVHEVSPAGLPFDTSLAQGPIASSVGVGSSIRNNVSITGDLEISGNNVVNFAGSSPSLPVAVYLNGSVDIVGNGTLVLRYATLYLVGAKSPYDRYVRLSNATNGHPRLIAVNSSIAAKGTTTIVRGRPVTVAYGFSVYAYDNSEISVVGLALSSSGGQTSLWTYGEASVSLTNIKVDSVFTYDEAQVSIYTGTGQNATSGIGFKSYNTSITNLNAVTFKNITAFDDAHLILTHCTQIATGVVITTQDRARVDCLAGTTLTNSQSTVKAPAIPSLFPAINASGYSYVSLSSSKISAAYVTYPIVFVSDHATFAVTKNGQIDSGLIRAFDYSRVVLNNSAKGLTNVALECHNSSGVSVFNTTLISRPFLVQISLFDSSSFSLVKSTISGGVIKLFDSAAFYASNSTLDSSPVPSGFGLRMVSQDDASLTFVAARIHVYSLELKDNSTLSMDSSVAWNVYCLSSSKLSLVGGEVSGLSVSDSSKVYAMNSTLDELSLLYSDVTGSFTGLTGFFENSSFALAGDTFVVNVVNTTINALSFSFSGHSSVTISDSTIRNLSVQGSSIAALNSTDVQGSVYVTGDSKVLAYTPLRVRCVDYFGNPLDGSVVTITTGYVGAPVILRQQTADKNGLTEFILFSEMDNATGSFPFGMATVSGSFGGVKKSQDISLSLTNKDVTLSFPLPSWSTYILPLVILVLIVVLLALAYYALKRVRRKRD